jgi:hypothetical protein
MGAGFIQRFGSLPSQQQIQAIEGVVIVDGVGPAQIQGTGTGVVAVVGEFADMTFAVEVAGGNVASKPQPQLVTSDADLVQRVGGFDATLGEFGGAGGNGLADVRGKRFAGLVVAPVNLASDKAVRLVRDLPTNASATDPSPVIPMQGATVFAGTLFQDGSAAKQTKTAGRVIFSGAGAYLTAIDGVSVAAGSSGGQLFQSASAAFVTNGVAVGDAIVIGVLGTDADAGTYRVRAISSETQLVVGKLDGTNFAWTGDTALPFRIHAAACADSGAGLFTTLAQFTVPARPIMENVAEDVVLVPAVPAAAGSATAWEPLSGLKLCTQPGAGNGLDYTAAVQAPNAANSSGLIAKYVEVIAALEADADPANGVNIVMASRSARLIAKSLRLLVDSRSAAGLGMVAVVAPGLGCQTLAAATSSASGATTDSVFGVAAVDAAGRSDRVIYTWTGIRQYNPDAAAYSAATSLGIETAIGSTVTDGVLDLTAAGHLCSVLSQIAPERNPGELTAITQSALVTILGQQRGAPVLTKTDYEVLKAAGICGIRIDRTSGPVFQSGITTSLVSGRTRISRRRMADFIQDSLARQGNLYVKQLLTDDVRTAILSETDAFLASLRAEATPQFQRIAAYSVDGTSGNTPEQEAAGIYVVAVNVRLLSEIDNLVLVTSIGESVQVTVA